MTAAPTPATLMLTALPLHLAGQLDAAEALYRQVLSQDPSHAQALGMLAMIVSDRDDDAETEAVLQQHLRLSPDNGASLHRLGRLRARQGDDAAAAELFERGIKTLPGLAPLHNELGVALYRLGRYPEAAAAFDHAVALDPGYAVAHGNRGAALYDCGRFGEAAEAQYNALRLLPPGAADLRASALSGLWRAARKAGAQTTVEAACQSTLAAGPTDPETIDHLATMLEYLNRRTEAMGLRNTLSRRTGVRRAGPAENAEATVLLLGGVGAGHIPTRYLVDKDRFETLTVELLSPDQPDAPLGNIDRAELARADIVFNTLGEVDKQAGQFAPAETLCAELGKPVLNPVQAILKTGRDQAPALYGEIAGLVTPAVRWTTPTELKTLPLDAPILVRPAGDHGGENLTLLRREADRDAYLLQTPADARLLATDFHDFRSGDGCWRKYRLIFIDRQVFPYHLAIGDSWLMHYWRAEMGASAWKKAEEERFLADWRGVFGKAGAQAVEAVAQRLDLDYGGLDCALLDDGRVVLFEANACILLHLDEPAAAFPYKHRYIPPIREAFNQMVRRRIADARRP